MIYFCSSQVRSVSPNLTDGYFAASVLLALLGNILVAIGIRKFFECNRESLLCLWRWLPFTQQRCPVPNLCCRFCNSDPNQCYPQSTCGPSCAGSRSCCDPPPVCCPKPRPGRPRKNRKCPDPCCPVSKPKCRKPGCNCLSYY